MHEGGGGVDFVWVRMCQRIVTSRNRINGANHCTIIALSGPFLDAITDPPSVLGKG